MPSTGDGWAALLGELDDDQLAKYALLAIDQEREEDRHRWVQVGLSVLSVVVAGVTAASAWYRGVTWTEIAGLAAAGALAYWPYRKAKSRNLWRRHLSAARAEQARRIAIDASR